MSDFSVGAYVLGGLTVIAGEVGYRLLVAVL